MCPVGRSRRQGAWIEQPTERTGWGEKEWDEERWFLRFRTLELGTANEVVS